MTDNELKELVASLADDSKRAWQQLQKQREEFQQEMREAENRRLEAEERRLEAEERMREAENRRLEAENRRLEAEERRREEEKRSSEELKQRMQETDRQMKETDRKLKELGINVGGIGNSNGKFAEGYFISALEKSKAFAGIHFDIVDDKFRRSKKMPDGSKLKDQFDVVMTNDKSVALIEVKYKAEGEHIDSLVNKKVMNFKILFPDYDGFDFYLGLGSFSFDDETISKAKEYGVGLLKQVGETIEYRADWAVKAYR